MVESSNKNERDEKENVVVKKPAKAELMCFGMDQAADAGGLQK
jgi:hypothetical protein